MKAIIFCALMLTMSSIAPKPRKTMLHQNLNLGSPTGKLTNLAHYKKRTHLSLPKKSDHFYTPREEIIRPDIWALIVEHYAARAEEHDREEEWAIYRKEQDAIANAFVFIGIQIITIEVHYLMTVI